jgi:hypothetical protein
MPEEYNGRTAEQIISKLLIEFFYECGGLNWSYVEGTTVGDINPSLEKSLLEFQRKHRCKST